MKLHLICTILLSSLAFIEAFKTCTSGKFNTSNIKNGGPYQSPVDGVKITNGLIRIGYGKASNLFSTDPTMSPKKPLLIEFSKPVKEVKITYNTCGVRGKGGVVEVLNSRNKVVSRKVTDGKYCGRINLPLFHEPFYKLTVKGTDLRKIRTYFELNDTHCNTPGDCNYGIGLREVSWKC